MAAIGITVKNGLWSVGLDNFEWTALEADGHSIKKINNEWNYTQTEVGNFSFTATAVGTQYLNPGQTWVEECNGVYYMLVLDYSPKPNGFDIKGYGINLQSWGGASTSSPHKFSQGKMNGVYSVKS
ncbi:MAG: hypothetical protein ACI93P_001788 [bacterium]|jgi:hypothetical protein